MFRRNIVVGLVSQFDEFIMDVLRVAYEQNAGWLKNPEKKLSYKEVLESSCLESLKQELVGREIEQLMRDSHHSQLSFLDSKLKLGLQDGFSDWDFFIELTERRNIFVHNGGNVNQSYIANSEKYGFPLSKGLKEGVALSVSDDYMKAVIDCLHELTVRVSQGAARRMFTDCFEEADRLMNNETVELLSDERWEISERIFSYTLGLPNNLRSGDEYRFYALINLCIALKFSGRDYNEKLNSVDWEPMHPKYKFAVAVLEDRFDDASTLMKSEAVLEAIPKENFLDWPLLRDFRGTSQFEAAFEELFSEDEADKLIEQAREEIDTEQDVPPKSDRAGG